MPTEEPKLTKQDRMQVTRDLLKTAAIEDRLLNVTEASKVLGVSTDWLYRRKRWKTLPFTVVLSERKIMFSLQGLLEWLKEQRNGRTSIQERPDVSHSV